MKKQTSAMQRILVYLLAFFTFTLSSCKKEKAQDGGNESPISSRQTIQFVDIQAYIDKSIAMELLSLDWKSARQTTIGDKNVVRVPTLNIDKTSAFFKNNGSAADGRRRVQASGTSVGDGTFNEGNNVNYDSKHPPEVFFIQQSGHNDVNAYLLNFVPDNKGKENGENGIWTGKLLEWNLTSDNILVQEIEKSGLKDLYTLSLSSVNKDSVKVREEGDFWRKVRDTLEDFVGWVGSLFGISSRAWDPYYGGSQWRLDPKFGWATGGYGGSNNDDGNSDGSEYYGAGYPVYDDYIPGYRPSDAFGAPSYPANNGYSPYRGGPNVSSSPYTSSLNYLVDNINLTQEQIGFLEGRDDIAQALKKYLQKNGLGTEQAEFAEWAVEYLKENPTEDVSALVAAGTSIYYTDAQMLAMINSIADPITGNGIELYLILRYKGSKLFELSRYSKSTNSIDVGEYTLTPHYDKLGKLLFYAGSRLGLGNGKNGIEYIIKPEQLNNFRNNIDYYTSAASLVYLQGIPDRCMVQMMAGDRVSGLLNLWEEALKSPEYWLYLINCFVVEPYHPKVRAAITESVPVGAPYTRSTLELGRKMHAEYKLGLADGVTTFKEYTKVPGVRPDFVNFNTKTIFELKPNNPTQIKAGNAQLLKYKKAFEETYGGTWNTVLDLY